MRIAFLGTPEFAVPSLEAVAGAGHEIAAVVCRPDRPSGRGLAAQQAPVARAARARGLPLLQPEKVNAPESVEALRATRPEILVVVAFGAILKPALLTLAPRGAANVHGSLLPAYRGAAPIARAIQAGESFTGITTMHLVEEMDAGDMILQRCAGIGPDETSGELSARLAAIGAELLVETLRRLERGDAPRIAQDASRATFAPRLEKEHGRIDWTLDAIALHNFIRAMAPWPGAATHAGGRSLAVRRARPLDRLVRAGVAGGSILEVTRAGALVVQTGEGAIALEEVQPENRRAMTGAEFARGARLGPGGRLGDAS